MPSVPTLRVAQDDAADELLSCDPLALLIGMLLDGICVNEAVASRADGAVTAIGGAGGVEVTRGPGELGQVCTGHVGHQVGSLMVA
jgi:hypothetical protein